MFYVGKMTFIRNSLLVIWGKSNKNGGDGCGRRHGNNGSDDGRGTIDNAIVAAAMAMAVVMVLVGVAAEEVAMVTIVWVWLQLWWCRVCSGDNVVRDKGPSIIKVMAALHSGCNDGVSDGKVEEV